MGVWESERKSFGRGAAGAVTTQRLCDTSPRFSPSCEVARPNRPKPTKTDMETTLFVRFRARGGRFGWGNPDELIQLSKSGVKRSTATGGTQVKCLVVVRVAGMRPWVGPKEHGAIEPRRMAGLILNDPLVLLYSRHSAFPQSTAAGQLGAGVATPPEKAPERPGCVGAAAA